MRPSTLIAASIVLLISAPAHAQSIWGVNGSSLTASNTAGPPGCSPCPIAGPLLDSWNYAVPSGCSVPGAFAPPVFGIPAEPGDITVNRVADTVWITDGMVVAGYTKAGVAFADFINPLPFLLTGLGYQAPNTLWLTDGFHYAAVIPPPTCGGTATLITMNALPFACLLICASDIDYDPCNDRVLVSYASGTVAAMTTAGLPLAVYTLGACPIAADLTGLAVDTITPNTYFVTDGVTVARVLDDGTTVLKAAATTIYAPCCSWPWAGGGGPTSGLAFDDTPIETCPGCNPTGAPPPVLKATGQALSPGLITLTLTGAPPLPALLVVGPCACPGIPLPKGCPLCVTPQITLPLFPSSSFTLSAPIPAGFGCHGFTVCVQAVSYDPTQPSLCPITSNAIVIGLGDP